ncbi:MAG: hypothetical protein K0U47_08470 [Epsilonproteobacteria bacterium]|nr:hypothetical protein [Campylobacterota bacterium]
MVKKGLIVLLLLGSFAWSEDQMPQNIYEKNCLPCHQPLSIGLDKIFFRYLIKYSSEISVKSALIDFLKNPNKQTSAMSSEQLRLLGVKSKTNLQDSELKEAIDIYWERYNVSDKLW